MKSPGSLSGLFVGCILKCHGEPVEPLLDHASYISLRQAQTDSYLTINAPGNIFKKAIALL